MRAYLAILSAEGCELVLHGVFFYSGEIVSSSIGVTIKPKSIYLSNGKIQDFNTGHFTINLSA
jgi:hypothetical protein